MTWPKITVVVPSFNQAPYLPEALDSVLGQGYPNLELIVIDGGSTDGSRAILEHYGPRLSSWVSEPDGGQTRGLIKGFGRATGEIQCWLNSDDRLEPGSLVEVARYFLAHPETDAVFGDTRWIDRAGRLLREQREIPFNRFLWLHTYNYVHGMSMFWRRALYERVGGLDASFDLAMDADLWIRFADVGRIDHVRRCWSSCRSYPTQKNQRLRAQSNLEDQRIRERYCGPARPGVDRARRTLAKAARVTWKLATGCYSWGYQPDVGRIAGGQAP
jgi:glycosyltransferase involved in cell wall biosynthesis